MSSSDGARSILFAKSFQPISAARLRPESAPAAPLLSAELRRVLAALPAMLRGARDRALLLVGWAAVFRRAELVSPGLIPWPLRSAAVVDIGSYSRYTVVLARGEREVGRNRKGSVDLSMDSACSSHELFG